MISQLVDRLRAGVGGPALPGNEAAVLDVLNCDVLDLILHLEQVWGAANRRAGVAGAREALISLGRYRDYVPQDQPAWNHLGYAFVLENSRVVQILRRVVREHRSGGLLAAASPATERWLDTTETLLSGSVKPLAPWLAASSIPAEGEAVRRNAYWRMLGMDLAFGDENGGQTTYEKVPEANTGFTPIFETLLSELMRSMQSIADGTRVDAADDDRVFHATRALHDMLRSRRRSDNLSRAELGAATALGWAELTLASNSPVVADLRAAAATPAERLRLIGERVGIPAHQKSAALFSMAPDLSLLLRTVEAGVVSTPDMAWVLYLEPSPDGPPPGVPKPIGSASRRVITEWSAVTGRDLRPTPR